MKYLVTFITNYDRSTNKKKSYYELIVCDTYNPDISGMIALNNCLVSDNVQYEDESFREHYSMFRWNFPKTIKYNYSEAQIIVNREDVENIKSIEDDQVFMYISKLNKEEATIEAKKLEKESHIKYKEDEKKYKDSLEKKNDSKNNVSDERTWLIKIKNQIEDFLQRSLK